MYRRHGDKLALVFLAFDLIATALAWLAAYAVRFSFFPSPEGIPAPEHVLYSLPGVLVLGAVSYRLCGLYEVHRLKQLRGELRAILRADGLLFLLAITVTFYRRDLYESRLALALFLGLNAASIALGRRLIWQIIKRLRQGGLNHGRAVIVGAGRTARRVAETILANRWTGLEAIGFVDEASKISPSMLPLLGSIEGLSEVIRRHDIDHVFIALPLGRYGELRRVYEALSDVLVEVQLIPDLRNTAGMKLRMLEIDDVAFLGLRQSPHHGWPRIAKRAMDLGIGGVALFLLAPLMAVLAAAIWITDGRPILYRQRRVGLGGSAFDILKFRSMPTDAEEATGPIWASRDDQRASRLGHFMRQWSLDELPQLLNVLLGHMSLVGPRPERGVFVEKFRKEIPDYTQRHQVKSGMTGWAQIHGWRGDTSLRRRIQCDLYYVSHWSLGLDLKILYLTLRHGLWRSSVNPTKN